MLRSSSPASRLRVKLNQSTLRPLQSQVSNEAIQEHFSVVDFNGGSYHPHLTNVPHGTRVLSVLPKLREGVSGAAGARTP